MQSRHVIKYSHFIVGMKTASMKAGETNNIAIIAVA